MHPFFIQVQNTIVTIIKARDTSIEKDVVHMFMKPTLEAWSYRGMQNFGNHFKVASAKKHLITNDNGVATIFQQECVLRPIDENPIFAKLEYIGWVEEILELNYMVLKLVVLFCNWVKANYTGSSAIVK